jgi:hypothetical protein
LTRLISAATLFLLLILTACASAAVGEVPTEIRIGNQFVGRTFEVRDGHVHTVALLNLLDKRVYALDSDEFEIDFDGGGLEYVHGEQNPIRLTSRDFIVHDVVNSTPSPSERQLAFQMENVHFGLEIRLVFSLGGADRFLRKHLELRSTGREGVFLNLVAVEHFRLHGSELWRGGFGQPLFLDNVFFGLEYPASYNLTEGGITRCYYYVGQVTTGQWLDTESSVVGVASEGAVRRAFLDYVATIRAGKVRFTSLFNTWYDMQGDALTTENSLDRMATLKRKLLDPYGLRLDSFVLDDGWDDLKHLWEIDPFKFKGGFEELSESLEASGSRLGLWYGPVGGYGPETLQRLETGRRNGYEITEDRAYFCIAGPSYHAKLKQSMLEMVRKYHVNHFKIDGVPFMCNSTGHGHLTGIYSREADMRAFIDILSSLRAADPNIFLNFTTGSWLSPWWLKYADTLFINGLDYGYLDDDPSISEREKAISYRDKVMFEDFREYADEFPVSSINTLGLIKARLGDGNGASGAEGGLGESLESFTNAAIMFYSRGSMLNELYISPSILKEEEWRVIGGVMRWAHDASDVLLADTKFILGDPSRREVYGYAHLGKSPGIITVRNPYIEPRSISVRLDRSSGLDPSPTKFRARIIFPYNQLLSGSFSYGDSIPLNVEGYQILVARLEPDEGQIRDAPSADVRFNAGKNGMITTYDPKTSGAALVHVKSLEFFAARGSFVLDVPKKAHNVRLALLCQPNSETTHLTGKLTNNGANLAFTAISPHSSEAGLGVGESGGERWTFLVAPLSAPENQLTFEILNGDKPFAGEVSVWLLADFELEKKEVFSFSSSQLPVQELPSDSGVDYRTIQLFTRRFD